MTVALGSGPLSMVTNPKQSAQVLAVVRWMAALRSAGHVIAVPAIADYEVRRELLRANKALSLQTLDAFVNNPAVVYLELTDADLKHAARVWALARNQNKTTADPKEIDADVILCAQILNIGLPVTDYVVATTNVGHLSLFVPAQTWEKVVP